MTLYLTSTGFENKQVANGFKNIITHKDLRDVSFLVISVQDNESDAFYLQKTKDELGAMGFTNVEGFGLKDDVKVPTKEYDVIYVCGGNTFVYLDRIRKTGLDKFIINSVKSGRSIYVGVSAGSIIAGPNIEMAGWGSEGDSNNVSLNDLTGLGLTNIAVFPHYHNDLKVELDEFKKTYDYQVYEITDTQAVCLSYSDMGALKNVLSMELINENEMN